MDKQIEALYPENGIPLSNKKEWTFDTCNNMYKSQNNYERYQMGAPG